MNVYLPPRFESIYPENIFDLIQWCHDYPQFDKFPVTPERRFGIALYQIHQCMDWKDNGVNKYEGLAAACLHFMQVAEELKLDIENSMPIFSIKLKEFERCFLDQKAFELLRYISRAQQQIYYGVSKTERGKRRYDKSRLQVSLSMICYLLICCIPIEFRSECFEQATNIIVKELK